MLIDNARSSAYLRPLAIQLFRSIMFVFVHFIGCVSQWSRCRCFGPFATHRRKMEKGLLRFVGYSRRCDAYFCISLDVFRVPSFRGL